MLQINRSSKVFTDARIYGGEFQHVCKIHMAIMHEHQCNSLFTTMNIILAGIRNLCIVYNKYHGSVIQLKILDALLLLLSIHYGAGRPGKKTVS